MSAQMGLGQSEIELPPLGDARIPLVVTVARQDARPGLVFQVDVTGPAGQIRRQDVRFIAPPR